MPETTTSPSERECLRCYLTRTLDEHGCDGTKTWTMRWRDQRAPQAADLLDRLADRGGCCCDCEMLFNVWDSPEDTDLSAGCQGSDHPDPLVPCTAWATEPETLVTGPCAPDDATDSGT
jgi:hypothetical protein